MVVLLPTRTVLVKVLYRATLLEVRAILLVFATNVFD
jgi:hypothetical protein